MCIRDRYEIDTKNDNINILGVFQKEDNKPVNILLDIKKSKSNILKLFQIIFLNSEGFLFNLKQ